MQLDIYLEFSFLSQTCWIDISYNKYNVCNNTHYKTSCIFALFDNFFNGHLWRLPKISHTRNRTFLFDSPCTSISDAATDLFSFYKILASNWSTLKARTKAVLIIFVLGTKKLFVGLSCLHGRQKMSSSKNCDFCLIKS